MAKAKTKEKSSNSSVDSSVEDKKVLSIFEKEVARLPEEIKKKIESKKDVIFKLTSKINEKSKEKSMGFYLTPEIEIKNNVPVPNFDKFALNFLYDDFEKSIITFNPRVLLENDFDNYLVEEKKKDNYGQEYLEYYLKEDKNVKFFGTSISILRENCFDGLYDDLKKLGSSFIVEDSRGFISALKTIDIHRNMLLQKFEKYVVVYAGAGSWLRGEKSNDFDVFVVVDDTDVKKMSRLQVKDQLTRIIWQMSQEVAMVTGVQIHIQVYLLTDFWDALKDAHPVMFTFLRDGVPFYDRGIYSAWKELLKLGKIRPSAEAVDMHMNVGTQLLDRAKKMFAEIIINDVYNSVLSPSQAILMLKGYNPTTPKETIKMFKEVLLAKEKLVSEKDVEILEETIGMFKKIEHDKELVVTGKDVDRLIKNAEDYLKHIKAIFEEISEQKTKDSIISAYNELLTQIRTLPGYSDISEKTILAKFELDYVKAGKLKAFVKESLNSFIKAKADYDKGKITVTEVNKVLKEVRNIMSEIKEYRDKKLLNDYAKKKLVIRYGEKKSAEIINYDKIIYLLELAENKVYELSKEKFIESKIKSEDLIDNSKHLEITLDENLISSVKKILKVDKLYF